MIGSLGPRAGARAHSRMARPLTVRNWRRFILYARRAPPPLAAAWRLRARQRPQALLIRLSASFLLQPSTPIKAQHFRAQAKAYNIAAVAPTGSLDTPSAVVSLVDPPPDRAIQGSRPDSSSATQRALYFLRLAALVATYFAAGKLGLALAFMNENASAVWPPAGIAVGALLVFGRRMWPGVAVGAFFVNLTTSGLILPSLAIATGNTLESLAGAWLMTSWAGGVAAFDRPGGVLRFSALACSVVPAIAASVGTGALVMAGLASASDALSVWITWWLGDAVGILTFTPLVVLWTVQPPHPTPARRQLEAGVVFVSIVAVAWIIFGNSPAGFRDCPLLYLAAPVLMWPAFRLGAREAMTAVTLLAMVAVAGTLNGFGPFARSSPNESLVLLQGYVGTFSILIMSVAAEVATRRRIEAESRALNDTLERRVETRTDELSRAHARLAEAQRVAHVGSWEWEVSTGALWWSDELYRIYGVPGGTTMTYDHFMRLVHVDDRATIGNAVRAALEERRPFAFEHRIVRPDGTERTLQAHGHVIVDAHGNVSRMLGTGHDITGRKRAEEERVQLTREQAARREAEAANRAKDEFLAILSHELRTPLNAALGWAQMLRAGREDAASARRAAEAIWRNLNTQTRLVSDMLDTSHILLGTLRLHRVPVDIAVVTREAADMIRDSAAARGVRLDMHLPSEPVLVHGDSGRLQQIIWNLLSNAAKFSREGGSIKVSVGTESGSVLLRVEDGGPGIAPEFLPHIFDRFRQADSSVTREHGGLGLGLAIARHLVEAHGGTITAANASNGGAIFTVRLPRSNSATE